MFSAAGWFRRPKTVTCPRCKGEGILWIPVASPGSYVQEVCHICDGQGCVNPVDGITAMLEEKCHND